ncbi:helix-turn-helix transcriptional regulator [Microbacterium sp. BWT-B31]|uniref:LuxR C-terminal-related transcriptional regulator n=1 Tax=Microbacterium sp. BWT-B31 TaxID=3232072 RepID=UPI0035293627
MPGTPHDRSGDAAWHSRSAAAQARRLLDRARSEARSGSLTDAWRACLAAADLARQLGDAELLAEAATAVSDPSIMWKAAGDRQGLCLEALGMLGPPPDDGDEPASRREWRALVRTHLEGLSTGWADGVVPSAHRIDRVEAERRFAGLQTAYLHALGVEGLPQRLALAHDAIGLGRAASDDHILAWGWHWRADALEQLGLRVDFNHAIGELAAVVERTDSRIWSWRMAAIRASIALLEDRLVDVAPLAEAARESGRSAGVEDAELFDLILRGALARRTREGLEGIEEEVRILIADAPFFAQGWRAEILLALGRLDEAFSIFRALMRHLDEIPATVHEWLVGHVALADLAVAAADRESSARLRAVLLPASHLHATGPATTPYGGPVALALAKLSALVGDDVAAQRFAADAVARAEAMGAPWYAASARQFALPRPASPLAPLSAREAEVARLVADGRTNREIATTLFLSERTVEQHVRSILHKLALPNRAAVAAWVARSSVSP